MYSNKKKKEIPNTPEEKGPNNQLEQIIEDARARSSAMKKLLHSIEGDNEEGKIDTNKTNKES